MTSIRIALPGSLQALAGVGAEVCVEVPSAPTIRATLDALEAAHPALRGTIRHHDTAERRAFIRYFACGRDLSHESPDAPLPDAVARGSEVFRVLGAISGG